MGVIAQKLLDMPQLYFMAVKYNFTMENMMHHYYHIIIDDCYITMNYMMHATIWI